ncbi:hypothetical protein ATO8_19924 [Roseivivax marinus]|uniref:Uncharacterized protein n=1 Tax=Roseivivax marinus TaxID=1379903 RepID=W4HG07_9RHOB|nr:hypothetical protein [Roseivivax marinus]ETW10900.1 hypothetical protein ATO8_19924 [Roseivivax marinus]
MKLDDWAAHHSLTDREIAERMTDWIRANEDPDADPVSVPAVQKYRHGRAPKEPRMRAIYYVTGGWVSANDFYGLPQVGVVDG